MYEECDHIIVYPPLQAIYCNGENRQCVREGILWTIGSVFVSFGSPPYHFIKIQALHFFNPVRPGFNLA